METTKLFTLVKFVLAGFVVLGLTTTAFAQYDANARKVLDAMSEKYKQTPSFEAKFSYMLEMPSQKPDKMEGNILVKNNKYVLDMGNQKVFNNERLVWTYIKDEEFSEVTITEHSSDPENPAPTEVFDMYKDGFKYRIVGEEVINGQKHDVIELDPEDRGLSYYKIILTISKSDNTLSEWQIFEKNGRKYTYKIEGFTPKNNLSDTSFEFDESEYPGVDVVDLR